MFNEKNTVSNRIVFYQPDIAQNLGALIRVCVCFGIPLDVVMPCGFPFSVKALKRTAMDYLDSAQISRHVNFDKFYAEIIKKDEKEQKKARRLILMSTKGSISIWNFNFLPTDVLMVGNESSGVSTDVADRADKKVYIPMPGRGRSLNVVVSASIGMAECLRQHEPQ